MSKKNTLLYFILFLPILYIVSFPDLVASQTDLSITKQSLRQVGAFSIKANAKRFAKKLKGEGFEVEIREGLTYDNETIYRVFASEKYKYTPLLENPSLNETEQVKAKQVGAFSIKANAKRFAEKLTREGFKVEIQEGFTKDNEIIYRVFAEKIKEPTSEVASAQGVQQDTSLVQEKVKDKPVETEEVPGIVSEEALVSMGGKIASFKVFREKKDAEEFSQKLKEDGFEVSIHKTMTRDRSALYTIFAKKPIAEERPSDEQKVPSEVEVAITENEDAMSEVASAQGVQQGTGLEQEPVKDKPVETEEVLEKPGIVPEEVLAFTGGKIASFKVFTEKEKAENFAQKLGEEGFEVTISEPDLKDKNLLYTVFAEKPKEIIEVPEPSSVEEQLVNITEVTGAQETVIEERPFKEIKALTEKATLTSIATEEDFKITEKEFSGEELPFIQKETIEGLKVSPKEEVLYSEVAKEPTPLEPSHEDKTGKKQRITADVFGRRGGYLHPFLSITGYYTDNVFNSHDNKKSDFVTVLSPGVWLSVPRIKQKLLSLNTSTIAPAGYKVSRASENFFRRYQVYLLYRADVELFSKYDSEDFFGQRIEGLLQYNFRGGFSFELADQFLISRDTRGTGVSTELDKYRSNLVDVRLRYDTGHRLWLQVDYTNFYVNYEDLRNEFRQRTDHALSGYIFCRLKPKTSAFFQYQYIDINYDEDVLSNSEEQNVFGGVTWDITAKSRGTIKAGYGTKNFTDNSIDTDNHFILEAQIDHRFTPKTSATFSMWRKTNETNISTTNYMLTHGLNLGFSRQFTGRITGDLRLSYIYDAYKDKLTFGDETKERRDNYYIGTLGFNYKFREWVGAGMGYTFTERNSTFSDFDYQNNMIWFNITGSL